MIQDASFQSCWYISGALSFKSHVKTNVKALESECLDQWALMSTTASQGPYKAVSGRVSKQLNSEHKVSVLKEFTN